MEIKKGIYRHYKGKMYEVLGVGKHTETMEDLVVYQGQYNSPEFGDKPIWIRPLAMFTDMVTVEGKQIPRFAYVETVAS